jgi:hypothetical protein
MSFEHVYRVTTLNPLISQGLIDALERDVPVPLPPGYREYLSCLGNGELCDLLRVRTPDEVRRHTFTETWERENQVHKHREGRWRPSALTPEDLEGAVTFADSAEGDQFVVCPRLAGRLFELPRHGDTVQEFHNGFWGVVDYSVRAMCHDFPFFEPFDDERRRYRTFDVEVGIGLNGLVEAIVTKWGPRA